MHISLPYSLLTSLLFGSSESAAVLHVWTTYGMGVHIRIKYYVMWKSFDNNEVFRVNYNIYIHFSSFFSFFTAKSLPLHCVVESVHSLQASLNIDSRSPFKRRPTIETDSYVIIAASTQWSDIVTTALQKLGYSNEVANTARGKFLIQLLSIFYNQKTTK